MKALESPGARAEGESKFRPEKTFGFLSLHFWSLLEGHVDLGARRRVAGQAGFLLRNVLKYAREPFKPAVARPYTLVLRGARGTWASS